MGYAEECERWAGEGFSGSDAADIAGSGVRPCYGDMDDADSSPECDNCHEPMDEATESGCCAECDSEPPSEPVTVASAIAEINRRNGR